MHRISHIDSYYVSYLDYPHAFTELYHLRLMSVWSRVDFADGDLVLLLVGLAQSFQQARSGMLTTGYRNEVSRWDPVDLWSIHQLAFDWWEGHRIIPR